MNFQEIGEDTTILERPNRVFVNKDPKRNENSLLINFNNFYYSDSILPIRSDNIIDIHGQKMTKYYVFETKLNASQKSIRTLYVSPDEGIIGFKTFEQDTFSRIYK
jgi:hypothetical protein